MIEPGEIIHGGQGAHWRLTGRLGQGKCCEVYAAELIDGEDEKVAIKLYKDSPQYAWACKREKALLRVVQRQEGKIPQLVCVRGEGVHKNRQYLVEEQLQHSLRELLIKTGEERFSLWTAQKLTMDVFLALDSLHRCGFVHGDLKPANLMWSPAQGCLKLIDFGLSFNMSDKEIGQVQSPGYQAPEVMIWNSGDTCRERLTTAIDMWSVGCLLLWMRTGKKLALIKEPGSLCENCRTTGNSEKCRYEVMAEKIILCGEIQGRESKCHLTDLLNRLFQCNPSKRPSAKEALGHQFFSLDLEPEFCDMLILSTCILRLLNMVDEGDLQDEEVVKDIQTDIETECKKFGSVEKCVIPTHKPGLGKVFVEFSKPAEAEEAFGKLNGRVFNDRTVITTFFCTESFRREAFY